MMSPVFHYNLLIEISYVLSLGVLKRQVLYLAGDSDALVTLGCPWILCEQ